MLDRFRFPTIIRAAAWACVVLIAYLSLIPTQIEIRTSLPGQVEHVVAYAGTAFLLALGYSKRIAWAGVGLILYACLLEYLQHYIPGRHSQLIDAAASGAGAILGIALRAAVLRFL